MANRPYYGIQFLDDIHTYFPDILYNPDRFTNVQTLLYYIRSQTYSRFDLFSNAQRNYIVPNPFPGNVTQPYIPQTSPLRQPPPIVRQPPPPQPPQQSYYNTNRNLEVLPLNNFLSSLLLNKISQLTRPLQSQLLSPLLLPKSKAQQKFANLRRRMRMCDAVFAKIHL